MYVCMCVCLYAPVSLKQPVGTSQNFLYMLLVAMSRSFCDDSAVRYVFPVLWTTMSCFHVIECMGEVIISKTGIVFLLMWWLCIEAPHDVMFGRVPQMAAPVGGDAAQLSSFSQTTVQLRPKSANLDCLLWWLMLTHTYDVVIFVRYFFQSFSSDPLLQCLPTSSLKTFPVVCL